MCVWLQVGYLYDRLLIDCLSLHNRRKGYLSVYARAMENQGESMCVFSFHNARKVIFYTYRFCRLNPTL